MNEETHSLGPLLSSFCDEPATLRVHGSDQPVLAREQESDTWSLSIETTEGGPAPELRLGLGRPAAYILHTMSFPASWIAEGHSVSFRAQSLLCVSPEEPSRTLSLEVTPPARCTLSRHQDRFDAHLRLGGNNGAAVVRGSVHPLRSQLPQLHRAITNEEAARSFLRFFALLHDLGPDAFGKPTQEHRRILASLTETRKNIPKDIINKDLNLLENPMARKYSVNPSLLSTSTRCRGRSGAPPLLQRGGWGGISQKAGSRALRSEERRPSQPKTAFVGFQQGQRPCEDQDRTRGHPILTMGPTPGGLTATWAEQKLLWVAGEDAEASFPGDAPAWRLLGAGAVTLNFSEDCKGLTVYAYDHYGRPRAAWGGIRGSSHRFSLRPGEQVAIEQG